MHRFFTRPHGRGALLAAGTALLVSALGILCLLDFAAAMPPTVGEFDGSDHRWQRTLCLLNLAEVMPRTGDRLIIGDMGFVPDNTGDEQLVVTWALLSQDGDIKEVGVTVPLDLFDKQPTEPGPFPHESIASLVFPEIVQDQTFLNHVELGTQPDGHEAPLSFVNPQRNRVPHFDFHFYAIPEAQVWEIPEIRPWPNPLLPDVAPHRLPVGYMQPVFSAFQMGRHSNPLYSKLDPNVLETTMIAGFLPDASQLHFIEPMISREFLLKRNDFELPVPMPAEFGKSMLYPTKCHAEYDALLDAYHFIFSEFVAVE